MEYLLPEIQLGDLAAVESYAQKLHQWGREATIEQLGFAAFWSQESYLYEGRVADVLAATKHAGDIDVINSKWECVNRLDVLDISALLDSSGNVDVHPTLGLGFVQKDAVYALIAQSAGEQQVAHRLWRGYKNMREAVDVWDALPTGVKACVKRKLIDSSHFQQVAEHLTQPSDLVTALAQGCQTHTHL